MYFLLTVMWLLIGTNQTLSTEKTWGKTHFIVKDNTLICPEKKPSGHTGPLNESCLLHDGCIKHALFSAHDDIQKMLIDLISKEQKSIKIAIFAFTDIEIAKALMAAHARGVTVRIICDCSCLRAKFSKISLLQKEGITVFVYTPAQEHLFINDLMHHKFVIFEKNIMNKSLLWTGSFNFTKSANTKNQENVLIIDDQHLIALYNTHFDHLAKTITKTQKNIALAQRKERKAARALKQSKKTIIT